MAARAAGRRACSSILEDDGGRSAQLRMRRGAFGRLHSVVYCAGPAIAFLKVREMPPAILARHLQEDTLGCFRLFHHAIPHLEAGGGGRLPHA